MADNCDFVIRGCQNRAVIDDLAANVDAVLANKTVQYLEEVEISERVSKLPGETRPRRKSRSARSATLGVRASQVTIRGPARLGGKLSDVTLNVVEVVEQDPPAGEEPIRWVLFTTLPIDSIPALQRVISTYTQRWQIELYFKTLKSGLKCEKLKYETLDRYLTAFAFLMIVGFRVEYLKGAARQDSAASCEKYFSADDWRIHAVSGRIGWLAAKEKSGPARFDDDLAGHPPHGSLCRCLSSIQKGKSEMWGIKRA